MSAGYTTFKSQILSLAVPITSAQILNSFTSPVQLLPAPGAGLTYDLITVNAKITFNSIAYATNTTSIVYLSTTIMQNTVLLTSTNTRTLRYTVVAQTGNTADQVPSNTALFWSSTPGNPTGGNSSIIVYLLYRIITL